MQKISSLQLKNRLKLFNSFSTFTDLDLELHKPCTTWYSGLPSEGHMYYGDILFNTNNFINYKKCG